MTYINRDVTCETIYFNEFDGILKKNAYNIDFIFCAHVHLLLKFLSTPQSLVELNFNCTKICVLQEIIISL